MTVKPKILFVCTEDWFFQSHFLSLYDVAVGNGEFDAALTCSVGKTRDKLEAYGIKVWPVDVTRSSAGLISATKYAWQLFQVYRREKPDIIHLIGLKPIMVGGIVALICSRGAKMYHVIGLGAIAEGMTIRTRFLRHVIFRLLAFMINRPKSHVGVENPDDINYIRKFGKISDDLVTQFGGAGIDVNQYQPLDMPENEIPKIAFVGRMIWTKGVDILIEAHQNLLSKGVVSQLDLYGEPDIGNPSTVTCEQLTNWGKLKNVTWHGQSNDISGVWQRSDICVISTRTREGMPRAMLEAAAYGRPLVVTDVPGCRHFVRDGVEGYIAKPDNTRALASALNKLISSKSQRIKMGKAARTRVLDGYTKEDICARVLTIYRNLLN